MKQMMMALAILGYSCISAEAQTTTKKTPQLKNPVRTNNTVKVSSSKTCKVTYGQNYKVCKSKGGKYYTCGTRPSTMTCTDAQTKSTYTTTNPGDAAVVEQAQSYNGNMPAGSSSAYDKNYKVCNDNGTYHICGEDPNSEAALGANSNAQQAAKTTTFYPNGVVTTTSTQTYPAQPAVAPVSQSLETEKTYTGNYPNQLPNVVVKGRADTINNANAPYHGKNSPQYDGLEKNKLRNLNTPPQSPNASFDGK